MNEKCLFLNLIYTACIGALGQNCSTPCSSGYYGRLCKSKCLCPENQCDKLTGCVKGKLVYSCLDHSK